MSRLFFFLSVLCFWFCILFQSIKKEESSHNNSHKLLLPNSSISSFAYTNLSKLVRFYYTICKTALLCHCFFFTSHIQCHNAQTPPPPPIKSFAQKLVISNAIPNPTNENKPILTIQ
ncbi:hypothetical protein ACOSQ3_015945 [Xanthoceras sorbifolium]